MNDTTHSETFPSSKRSKEFSSNRRKCTLVSRQKTRRNANVFTS